MKTNKFNLSFKIFKFTLLLFFSTPIGAQFTITLHYKKTKCGGIKNTDTTNYFPLSNTQIQSGSSNIRTKQLTLSPPTQTENSKYPTKKELFICITRGNSIKNIHLIFQKIFMTKIACKPSIQALILQSKYIPKKNID